MDRNIYEIKSPEVLKILEANIEKRYYAEAFAVATQNDAVLILNNAIDEGFWIRIQEPPFYTKDDFEFCAETKSWVPKTQITKDTQRFLTDLESIPYKLNSPWKEIQKDLGADVSGKLETFNDKFFLITYQTFENKSYVLRNFDDILSEAGCKWNPLTKKIEEVEVE